MKKPDGPARRALRMAAMSAGVTGSYLGYLAQSAFLSEEKKRRKLKDTHSRAARRVSSELVALRGPAMKLGQTLSLQTDFLPEETLAELGKLQMQAPGMHPSLVRAQFKASIGRDPEDVYERFDVKPFAAASLGQVHHASLEGGRDVAVKIQYPGIRDAIDNDFKWFRTVSKPAKLSHLIPEDGIDELQEQIAAECDYVHEAKNIQFFRKHLTLPFVELPRVYRKHSTDKVLTMSLVRGQHIDDFLASRPSQKIRDVVGERLFELFYFQLLRMKALHADPHWGNYLFREDGTIGLVDFGCVKYFPADFIENLRKLFLYTGRRDSAEFRRILDERYAGRGARLNPAARNALVNMSESFYGVVYPPDPERDHVPFDFGRNPVMKNFMRASTRVGRAKGALPEYIFLARAETGMYVTLQKLRARVHTSAIVRKYL